MLLNKKNIIMIFVLLVVSREAAFAYEDKVTHPAITDKAIENSQLDQYLKNNLLCIKGLATTFPSDNLKQTVSFWLSKGATAEDALICRRSTHFHNPLRSWKQAGMDKYPVNITCTYPAKNDYRQPGYNSKYSALVWATGYEDYNGTIVSRNTQTMGWDKARDYYYAALTSTMKDERETFFAATLQAVGQVLHLLQDMAVPAHVRNDFITSHLNQDGMNNPYELYVFQNNKLISDLQSIVKPLFASPITSDFWDTVGGDSIEPPQITNPMAHPQTMAGLAEYTNANYLSEGTLFWNSGIFRYPMQISTDEVPVSITDESGQPTVRKYYRKKDDWETGFYLAAVPFWQLWNPEANPPSERVLSLDELVHKHYAERLLPRAIGYSAALLDYFFRGTLEISLPAAGVYSIADGSKAEKDEAGYMHQQFVKIKAKVRNTTPNDEPIGAGTLTAVARYKIIPNYAPDLSSYPPDAMAMKAVPYSYSISQARPVSEVPRSYTEYEFQFNDASIPAGITDLTLQVVFKGTLGNEVENAVAVGMKDLMEPTHLTFWNLTDMHSIDYPGPEFKLYTLDSLKKLADGDGGLLSDLDDTPVGAPNGILDDEQWLRGQTDTIDIYFGNGTELQPAVSVDVPEKGYIRMIVLVDRPKVQFLWLDTLETGGGISEFNAAVNQADKDGEYPTATPIEKYRKVKAVEGQEGVPSVQHYYDGAYKCTMLHSADCDYPIADADAVSDKPVSFTSQFYKTH